MNPLIDSWLSPAAATIVFWVAVAVCAVAQLYILRAVFRTLPDAPTNSAVPAPRQWAEVVQAFIPLFGLAALFFGAWRAMSS